MKMMMMMVVDNYFYNCFNKEIIVELTGCIAKATFT